MSMRLSIGSRGREEEINAQPVHLDAACETYLDDTFVDSDYDQNKNDEIHIVEDVDYEVEWSRSNKEKEVDTECQVMHVDMDNEITVNESSDDYEPDDLQSLCSDDENGTIIPEFPRFNPKIDMENPQFRIGMIFTDANEFKDAVKVTSCNEMAEEYQVCKK